MPVELGRLVCSALLNVLIGHRVEVHMLVVLGRLAPTAIEQGDGGADLSGRRGRWVIQRANKRLQRLRRIVARP